MKDKRVFRSVLWRRLLIALMLLGQIVLLIWLSVSSSRASQHINGMLQLVSLLVCLSIIYKQQKDAYKLIWIFVILIFPVFGGLFYLLLKFPGGRAFRRQEPEVPLRPLYLLSGDALTEASQALPEQAPQQLYLQRYAGYPVYDHTQTRYFPSGEAYYAGVLADLEQAENYIFLEYFIVEDGEMWGSILEILKKKAAQGVKVRFLYDDMGCILRMPTNTPELLKRYGIECRIFNPFHPFLSSLQNNRDHRKILSIDGKVAYTGGVNLADEYINVVERFGHWKDAGIRVEGKAAWSLTLIFLQMWQNVSKKRENLTAWYPGGEALKAVPTAGFVQPYADTPLDGENVGETVYRRMIDSARNYLYIMTPYLILDEDMLSALCVAAKSGVDVRILTPAKWDKRFVHITTRSYYRGLLEAGVQIWEYTPGFVHSKTMVTDDRAASVGTTNLDFRSLYLHFECGVLLYDTPAVAQVKEDFLTTLPQCRRIHPEDCPQGFWARLGHEILRVFAPLM